MEKPVLAIIVPCYNEEEIIKETFEHLNQVIENLISSDKIKEQSFILFIDDGSSDGTWDIIKELKEKNNVIRAIRLSRNFGHQYALLAGLRYSGEYAHCTISIDADLQQDENAIYEFIDKYYEGYEIVYGVRENREADNFLKKTTALCFYNLMSLMGTDIIKNHADYRLITRKVTRILSEYNEANFFLRGILPTIGLKSTAVYHKVRKRAGGKSKYSFANMLAFALSGIVSFSIVPIRVISFTGFLIFIFSLVMSLYVLIIWLSGKPVVGWASTVLPIYFIGGIQLLSLGLIGEYIGRLYREVKRRPKYIIEEELK